jgi:hypothetical protein
LCADYFEAQVAAGQLPPLPSQTLGRIFFGAILERVLAESTPGMSVAESDLVFLRDVVHIVLHGAIGAPTRPAGRRAPLPIGLRASATGRRAAEMDVSADTEHRERSPADAGRRGRSLTSPYSRRRSKSATDGADEKIGPDKSTRALRTFIIRDMGDAGTVLEEALKLPAGDRGRIVRELIRSLDEDSAEDAASVEAAWGVELEARARRARAGEPGVDLDTVLERIDSKRKGR